MGEVVSPMLGDYAVVQLPGAVGKLISLGELLNGSAFGLYDHALIYVGRDLILQAEPGGAQLRSLRDLGYEVIRWSTGIIKLTNNQRLAICEASRKYAGNPPKQKGVPYSFLDYFALVAHRLHLPVPWLKKYIRSTKHMICSQLVDQCYQDAGVQLFNDRRWPGFVTPADLAGLLNAK